LSIKKYQITLLLLVALLIIIIIFSLCLGRYRASVGELIRLVLEQLSGNVISDAGNLDTVLFKIRIPRTVVAVCIGIALSTSGACYQGLFKNPMVSPDILGASSGACLGASIAILFDFDKMGIQILSFLCGMLAVALTYGVSMVVSNSQRSILILVLSGMVTESLFSALMSIIKYLADSEDKLPAITFWLMGSLASVTPVDAKILLVIVLLAYIPLFLLRWKLNVLSCGEEEAMALGMDIKKIQGIIIFSSTLLAAASVSIAGKIGWIGLIVPHIARLIVGPNYKYLIPVSALIGGIFLLVVDNLARSLVSVEIPLGILTSLCGTPFFFYLLLKGRKSWV
jgi:iron complex transport system permease protein